MHLNLILFIMQKHLLCLQKLVLILFVRMVKVKANNAQQ